MSFVTLRKRILAAIVAGGVSLGGGLVLAKQATPGGAAPQGTPAPTGPGSPTNPASPAAPTPPAGPAGDHPPAETPAGGSTGAPAAGPSVTDNPSDRSMSSEEAQSEADDFLREMREQHSRVLEMQEQARSQTDMMKLNCINEQLLTIRQMLNLAETARTNLTEAIKRNDIDGRVHEFAQVRSSASEVERAGQAVNTCVGNDLGYVNKEGGPAGANASNVTVEPPAEPPAIETPGEAADPTATPPAEVPEVEPPILSSPYV